MTEELVERARQNYKGKYWKTGSRMGNLLFPDEIDRKSRSLCSSATMGGRQMIHINDGEGIRVLTPMESERLQGLPDGYSEGISNTQRYRSIGNGWNVQTIKHLFEHLKGCF